MASVAPETACVFVCVGTSLHPFYAQLFVLLLKQHLQIKLKQLEWFREADRKRGEMSRWFLHFSLSERYICTVSLCRPQSELWGFKRVYFCESFTCFNAKLYLVSRGPKRKTRMHTNREKERAVSVLKQYLLAQTGKSGLKRDTSLSSSRKHRDELLLCCQLSANN